jgi:hypothetical protein
MKTQKMLAIFIACTVGTSSIAGPLIAAPSIAAPFLSPDTLTEIELMGLVGPRMKGALVLRAQVLLERAHFSS